MSDTTTTGKLENIEDVIQFCQKHNLPAEVVGKWVWIEFDEKPDADTRQLIKDAGFRWAPRRGRWAHNCGTPSRKGPGDPREKYGATSINGKRDEDD